MCSVATVAGVEKQQKVHKHKSILNLARYKRNLFSDVLACVYVDVNVNYATQCTWY